MVIQEYQHIPIPSDLLVDLAGRGISIQQFTTALDVLNTPALLISLKNSGAIDQQVYYDLMKKYCLNVVSGSVSNELLSDLNKMNIPFTLYIPSLKGLSSESLLMTLNHKKALTNDQYEQLYRKYCDQEKQSDQFGNATGQLADKASVNSRARETVSLSVGTSQLSVIRNMVSQPTAAVGQQPKQTDFFLTKINANTILAPAQKQASTRVQKQAPPQTMQAPPQTTQCLFSPLLIAALEKKGFVIKGHEGFIVDSLKATGLLETNQPITGMLMNLRLLQLLRKKNTVVGKDFVILALRYCVNWGPEADRAVLDDLLEHMLYDIEWSHDLLREFQEIADISDEVFKAIGSILLLKVNPKRATTLHGPEGPDKQISDSKINLLRMVKSWNASALLTKDEYQIFVDTVATKSERVWQEKKGQIFMHMLKKVTNYAGGATNLLNAPTVQVVPQIPTIQGQQQESRRRHRGRDDPNVMVISSDEEEDEEPKKAQLVVASTTSQEIVPTQQTVIQGEIFIDKLTEHWRIPQQVSKQNSLVYKTVCSQLAELSPSKSTGIGLISPMP